MRETKLLEENIVELMRLSFDSIKHLTTLSTGALILMVAFLEKLFAKDQEWKALIGVGLICFTVTTITAMSSMLQAATIMSSTLTLDERAVIQEKLRIAFNVIAFLFFIVGTVALCIFAFKNLY